MLALRADGVRPRILHAGCGGDSLPEWLSGDEVRLDVDSRYGPDIRASMDCVPVGDESFDAVYCSHALEHLTPEGAKKATSEFARLLPVGGCALIFVPDTEGVDPEGREPLFESPMGPITGWDIHHGKSDLVESMPYMRHHTAFTESTLAGMLREAGFSSVETVRIQPTYNLFAVAKK